MSPLAPSKVLFLVAIIIGSSFALESLAGASASSDLTLAREINVTSADLPSGTTWSSSPASPNSAAQVARARQAVACMKASGGAAAALSADAFGTTGVAAGVVTADVQSADFGPKGSSTGLPGISSEVDVVRTSSQATKDLSAFASAKVLACATSLVKTVLSQETGHAVTVSSNFASAPRHGGGSGGVRWVFSVKGSGLSATVDEDAYFYVQGRAEISFSFINAGTSFSTSSASTIVSHVMTRAARLAG